MFGIPCPIGPIAALKARVWVRQGRLTEALAWVREQGLSPDDDLSYLREFEHLTLARVLIAAGTKRSGGWFPSRGTGTAGTSLASSRRRRPDGKRDRNLDAASRSRYQAQGNLPQALAALERALTLAEPEGYVRIFVDEGEADAIVDFEFQIADCKAGVDHRGSLIALGMRTTPVGFSATLGSIIINPKSEIENPK